MSSSDQCFEIGHTQPKVEAVTSLLRVDAHDEFEGTIWSPRVWWVEAHWDGFKSKPHFADAANCPGCIEELSRRPKGFLLVMIRGHQKPVFLEITPTCGASINGKHPETGSLKGLTFVVRRERPTKRSPMKLRITGEDKILRLIGPDESPVKTLARLWRCEHLLAKWQENPRKNG